MLVFAFLSSKHSGSGLEWLSTIPWWLRSALYVTVLLVAGIGLVLAGGVAKRLPLPGGRQQSLLLGALLLACIFGFFALLAFLGAVT
jgi:hypothetical protein